MLINESPIMLHQNSEPSNAVITESECQELASLKNCQKYFCSTEVYIDFSKPLYGMSPEQYLEGLRKHNECFQQLKYL